MSLIDVSADWTWLRKESVNLNRCQEKLPEVKCKEKREYKKRQERQPRTVRQSPKL